MELIPKKPQSGPDTDSSDAAKPLRLDISDSQLHTVTSALQSLVWQYRGIAEVDNLSAELDKAKPAIQPPLVERLDDYPHGDCDLTNLVGYPPKTQPVPVKPLFFDVAFNYIEYPKAGKKTVATGQEVAQEEVKKETKRGWFGFGR